MTSSVHFRLFYDTIDRTIKGNDNYVTLDDVVSDNSRIKEVYHQFIQQAIDLSKDSKIEPRIHEFASHIQRSHNLSTKYFACLLPNYQVLTLSAEMYVSEYQKLLRDSNAEQVFLIGGEHVIRDMTPSEPVYKTLENTKEENERLRLALKDEKTKTAKEAVEMSRMINLVQQRESQLQNTLEKLWEYRALVDTLKASVSEKLDQLLQEVHNAKSDTKGSEMRNSSQKGQRLVADIPCSPRCARRVSDQSPTRRSEAARNACTHPPLHSGRRQRGIYKQRGGNAGRGGGCCDEEGRVDLEAADQVEVREGVREALAVGSRTQGLVEGKLGVRDRAVSVSELISHSGVVLESAGIGYSEYLITDTAGDGTALKRAAGGSAALLWEPESCVIGVDMIPDCLVPGGGGCLSTCVLTNGGHSVCLLCWAEDRYGMFDPATGVMCTGMSRAEFAEEVRRVCRALPGAKSEGVHADLTVLYVCSE